MTMTHQEARALIQRSFDERLTSDERAALDAHLSMCSACAAYARNQGRVHRTLGQSLPQRWPQILPASRSAAPRFAELEARVRRKRMRQRFLTAAQPVLWAGGVSLIAIVLIGLLSSVRPGTADETAALTESAALTQTATAEGTNDGETPVGPLPCTADIYLDTNVYAGPSTSDTVIGTLPIGTLVEVGTILYSTDPSPWLQITYEGQVGWISAENVGGMGDCGLVPTLVAEVPATATPSALPPPNVATQKPAQPPRLTETPTGQPAATVTPTPPVTSTWAPGTCYVTPVDETSNMSVFAGPDFSQPIIGTLQPGQSMLATGRLPDELYNSAWPRPSIRIDYFGAEGWVDASRYAFQSDGCWPIPVVDTWPTPIVTSTPTTYLAATLAPTSTLPPEVDLNNVIYISREPGSMQQFSSVLPDAQTGTVEYIGVRVGNMEPGDVRLVVISLTCTGANPQNLRWGYFGSSLDWECGRYIETGVSQGGNLVMLALAVPGDGMTSVTYTITVTVQMP